MTSSLSEVYDSVGNLAGDAGRIRLLGEAIAHHLKRNSPIQYALGPFMFSLDTASPQSLNRTSQYDWAAQRRLGLDVAWQYTGKGDDSIVIDGLIYPEYKGGLGQLELMRSIAGLGKKQFLIDGRGTPYGFWVITRVVEKQTIFNSDGTPKKVGFSIALSAYGDDINYLPF